MQKAVEELKAFVTKLRARPDVEVIASQIGQPASKKELATLVDMPVELIAFYREANGVHIEWRFVDAPGQGCLLISPVSEETIWQADVFAPATEALVFDVQQPECLTWLVRRTGQPEFRVLTGNSTDFVESTSIATYLNNAMANGLVPWWPMCFRNNAHTSFATQEADITRFRARPKKPKVETAKARVHINSAHPGARGRVERTVRIDPDPETAAYGATFAEIQLDHGRLVWVPTRYTKVLGAKPDIYEQLRIELPRSKAQANPLAVLELFAQATCGHPMVAAGILAPHDLASTAHFLVELYNAAIAARVSFTDRLPLPKDKLAFSASALATVRNTHCIGETFNALFAGLHTAATKRSAESGCHGNALLDAALVQALARCGKARAVVAALRTNAVLAWPAPQDNGQIPGLPSDAPLFGSW